MAQKIEYFTAESEQGRLAIEEVMQHSYKSDIDNVPPQWAIARVVDSVPVSFILVKPDGKRQQYGNLQNLSAIEPPLWMAIFANKYKADKLIDLEANKERIEGDKVIIFATGNHPSAHKQQYHSAKRLKKKLGKGKIVTRLPCDPMESIHTC